MGGHGRPLESAASRLKAVVSRISCFTELRPCVGAQVPRGGPPWRPAAPRGPKYWFLTPSGCESISHRFSHLFPNAPKRCRSPPLSALDPLVCPFLKILLRFYTAFQNRAQRLSWGPRARRIRLSSICSKPRWRGSRILCRFTRLVALRASRPLCPPTPSSRS